MTLHEQVLRALAPLSPKLRDYCIEGQNWRIYERRSNDLDYGTKVEVKMYSKHPRPDENDEARMARARQSFLRGILSSALHAQGLLPERPEPRLPRPGDGFLTHESWVAHLKEIDNGRDRTRKGLQRRRRRHSARVGVRGDAER